MDKIYLCKTAVKFVLYNENQWYINDNHQKMVTESLGLRPMQALRHSV